MRQTFNVLFLLRKYKNRMDQPQHIFVRITLNGRKVEMTTHLKCTLNDWDQKHRRVSSKTKEAQAINNLLTAIRSRINHIYYEQTLYGETTTPQAIKDAFTGADKKNHYLLELFQSHNQDIRKQVGASKSKTTYSKYEVTRKHLQRFLKTKSLNDILLQRINYQLICEFEAYLKTTAQCGHNTAMKIIQFFKRIIIIALNNGYIKTNPFLNYKIRIEKVDREYLTMDELRALMSKEIDIPRIELVRDLFVFSSFTGLSYIDLDNLKKENLFASFDGTTWIRINRNKTKETANIRLFDIPKMLIQKYAESHPTHIFPRLSNQKVNSYLKEIASICGIKKNLTFHVARHTMATTISLSNGLPIETLAKVLGHANVRTTQLYARITDIKLSQDMQNLSNILDKYILNVL